MATAAVKDMFATSSSTRAVPAAAAAMLVLLAAGGWRCQVAFSTHGKRTEIE
jgi:hypothetical protein